MGIVMPDRYCSTQKLFLFLVTKQHALITAFAKCLPYLSH